MDPAPLLALALHGDVKSFFLAEDPRPWFEFSDASAPALAASGMTEEEALARYGLSSDPVGRGIASGRLKLEVTRGERLRLDAHWAVAAETGGPATQVFAGTSGVGLRAPELVRLSGEPDLGGLTVRHRVDRLVLTVSGSGYDVAIGRQPISFGTGRFFTPLDLVNPFHPATIDTEYKPGVDALRVDAYRGVSSKLTVAAAYAGDQPVVGRDEGPVLDDLVLAASGQSTVGVTDLLGFVGLVHAEPVVGVGAVSSIGAVGVHGEGTVTVPAEADPFVRAVAGADWRPTATTTLLGEAYVQSFGAATPDGYLEALADPRFARGEVWQLGQIYAALAVSQEISPIVHANASVIANLRDPSAMVTLGGSWSVSDNAELAFGAYFGAGEAPDAVSFGLIEDPTSGAPVLLPPTEGALKGSVNSEFGLYPRVAWLQVRTYF